MIFAQVAQQQALTDLIQIGEVILIAVTLIGIVAAALVVRVTQARAVEWRQVAESREARINDLTSTVNTLRVEVGELRGAVEALERIKSQEIAESVIDMMGKSALVWDGPPGKDRIRLDLDREH